MESIFSSFRLPENIIEAVAIVVGILLGFIFSTSGWRGSKKPVELKDDPRVHSLKWAIGVGLMGFLGSWKELLNDDHLSRSAIGGFYAISFVLSSLIGVGIMTAIVMFGANSAKKREPLLWPQRGFSPVLEFWIHGYQHYQLKLDEAMEKRGRENHAAIEKLSRENEAKTRMELKKIVADAAEGLAACIIATDRYIVGVFPMEYVAETILTQIAAISKYFMQYESHVNTNWMLALRPTELNESNRKKIQWAFGNEERYEFFLEIKGYMNKNQAEYFLLPVEKRGSEGLLKILPGAPEAFMRRRPVVVSVNKLKWPKEVPQDIRKEIADYFLMQPFKSFVSLVIPGEENTPLGIVNIETDKEDVDNNEERLRQLIASLQPFLALLSLMIRYERTKS